MLLQNFAIAGVVVHDQRTQAGEIQPGQASEGRRRFDGLQQHLEPKCRAAIDLAVDADFAVHQGGELAANGETQTGAAVLSRRERVSLAEGIEYMALDLRGYAYTRVADLEAQQPILAACLDPHDDLAR